MLPPEADPPRKDRADILPPEANSTHLAKDTFLEEDGAAHAAGGLRRILTRVKLRNQEK